MFMTRSGVEQESWRGVLATAAAALLLVPIPLAAQRAAPPDSMSSAARAMGQPATAPGAELPHPFFTHMGMPEGVGVYSLRVGGLANRGADPAMGGRTSDFFFHFETGLAERIGLHVRNDQFRTMPRTEVMFQFLALSTRDGMVGFAPIVEFEVPTGSGAGPGINTLTGFTVGMTRARMAFNSALHFNPRDNLMDYSTAWVVAAGRRIFPVVEVLGTAGRGMAPGLRLLGGLKVPVTRNILVGLALQVPLTTRQDFSQQLVFGPDFDWSTRRSQGAR